MPPIPPAASTGAAKAKEMALKLAMSTLRLRDMMILSAEHLYLNRTIRCGNYSAARFDHATATASNGQNLSKRQAFASRQERNLLARTRSSRLRTRSGVRSDLSIRQTFLKRKSIECSFATFSVYYGEGQTLKMLRPHLGLGYA
jgi:hypothetical protein